jgi:hypothetical protein
MGRTGRFDETWIRTALAGPGPPKVSVVSPPEMVSETLELLRTRLSSAEDDLEHEYLRGDGTPPSTSLRRGPPPARSAAARPERAPPPGRQEMKL